MKYPIIATDFKGKRQLPKRVLLMGACTLNGLADRFPQSTRAEHVLWEFLPWTEVPAEINTAGKEGAYDLLVAAPTLRHVFAAVNDLTPEISGNDLAWARLIGTPRMQELFDHCCEYIRNKLMEFRSIKREAPLVFMSFIEPSQNYTGKLLKENSLDNPVYFIRSLNGVMAEEVEKIGDAYFIDVNEILNARGRLRAQDDILVSFSHASYISNYAASENQDRFQKSSLPTEMYDSNQVLDEIRSDIVDRIIDAFNVVRRTDQIKLIITDLDDTLWRGVYADNPDRPDWELFEGWPLGYMEALLIFKARGGLLAIVSKNDEEAVKKVFGMLRGRMRLSDFVSTKINFNPKSQNILDIIQEVNLLPENVLYIDDNPREIDEVLSIIPGLRTMSRQHYDWRRVILTDPAFEVPYISAESKQRTQTTQALIARETNKKVMPRDEWLKSLELQQRHRIIDRSDDKNFPRAFELLNKTNQFNTTGKRWTPSEMQEFFHAGGKIIALFLRDRLADNGLVGLCLIQGENIVQAVLSCRVFGFDAEILMGRLACALILANHERVCGKIIDTGKNKTCHSWFNKMGFIANGEGEFITKSHTECPLPLHIRTEFSGRGTATVQSVKHRQDSDMIDIDVIISNESEDVWLCDEFPINVSYHLFNDSDETVQFDGERSNLPYVICPGEKVNATITRSGEFPQEAKFLVIDVVHESRNWLSESGFSLDKFVL